jgi:hypothetical protein
MTLKELYNKIESYPSDTMNFCIEDVFSWRGSYDEPCCAISIRETSKSYNLNMLYRLVYEVFIGWKGGEFTYTFRDEIHFEPGEGSYTPNNEYLIKFITDNHNEEIKHIFS